MLLLLHGSWKMRKRKLASARNLAALGSRGSRQGSPHAGQPVDHSRTVFRYTQVAVSWSIGPLLSLMHLSSACALYPSLRPSVTENLCVVSDSWMARACGGPQHHLDGAAQRSLAAAALVMPVMVSASPSMASYWPAATDARVPCLSRGPRSSAKAPHDVPFAALR